MNHVEQTILRQYDDLNPTDKKIADYFLKNLNQVFHLSIAQLAQASGTSQAAWVRFAKSLGYTGLKALKRDLFNARGAAADPPVPFTDIRDYPDIESLCRAIKAGSLKAIEDTYQALSAGAAAEAVRHILAADTVRLFGVGASAMVAEDFYMKLTRIGMRALFHYDMHMQLSYAANASPDDVAFLISHTGATREVLEMQAAAKAAGAYAISLTRLEGNPLARRADLTLYTQSPEITYRSGAMSSRLAQLFVIDILYTAIANQNYDQVVARLQKSSKSCSTHRVPKDEEG